MLSFKRVQDPHYESAYDVVVDGQRIGTVRKRADGQWTGLSLTGWEGQDYTRAALARRMRSYGVPADFYRMPSC